MEVVLEETIMGVDHKTVCKVVATIVGIVVVLVVDITLPGLKEVCLDMDEVEVDLIKVQMLVDLESQVELFLEIPLDVSIVKNQAIYLDFV